MPTYEYRCQKCGEHLEVFQSFSEDPLTRHSGCGGKLVKVLSAAGIVLKGSGFYRTDSADSSRSRSKARSKSAPATAGSSASPASSGSSGSSDSSGSSGSGSSSRTETKAGGSEARSA